MPTRWRWSTRSPGSVPRWPTSRRSTTTPERRPSPRRSPSSTRATLGRADRGRAPPPVTPLQTRRMRELPVGHGCRRRGWWSVWSPSPRSTRPVTTASRRRPTRPSCRSARRPPSRHETPALKVADTEAAAGGHRGRSAAGRGDAGAGRRGRRQFARPRSPTVDSPAELAQYAADLGGDVDTRPTQHRRPLNRRRPRPHAASPTTPQVAPAPRQRRPPTSRRPACRRTTTVLGAITVQGTAGIRRARCTPPACCEPSTPSTARCSSPSPRP